MSWFGDNFGFEAFQLKDWLSKAKKNPEQLLIGAGDPLSAKMWGGITGKKYEPFVDQMGGPYGGHFISAFGNNDGGVYGRARAAGINTGPAEDTHDAAHVIAAMFAGNYGAGQAGGLMGSGGSGGSAGSSASASPASGFDWQSMMQNGQMPGLMGGQQEQQPPMIPIDLSRKDAPRQVGGRSKVFRRGLLA